MDYEAAVIGAGPGGLVSALYLTRYLRKTALVSFGAPRASWIPRTHNLLGYSGGISGVELLGRLQKQLDECGIDRFVGEAQVDAIAGGFKVSLGRESFKAKKLIIATGMTDVEPLIPRLTQMKRSGLLRYCPVCDAYEHREKKLLVLAQDSHGIKTAKFLSRFSKDIRILWPEECAVPASALKRGTIAGVKLEFGRLIKLEEVGVRSSKCQIVATWKTGDGGKAAQTKSPRLEKATKVSEGRFDAVYVALGSTINDSAFRHLKKIKRNEDGYITVGAKQETGMPGLFAVGDCVEGLSQIAVAAGHAAIAATRLHNDLTAGK